MTDKPKLYANGYTRIYKPDHPRADQYGYVLEHIIVMENKLGRYVNRREIIHHINGNKSDNRIENLQLIENITEHNRLHIKKRYEERIKRFGNKCKLGPVKSASAQKTVKNRRICISLL